MKSARNQGRDVRDQEFRNGMPFFGGSLWLDLLNTTPFDGTVQHDFIATPEFCRRWLAAAHLPSTNAGQQERELQVFRETLRTAVNQLRNASAVPDAVLDAVNAHLEGTVLRFKLTIVNGKAQLEERLDSGSNGPAGIIAEDFARFVCGHEPERLKRCSNPACSMVFYDRGKNNARRWCTMSLCGNRDKVARYRMRKGQAIV
jgi:predicted RNA-binding Zn ribbon-like protein